jgi:putative ATP-dependent endonuclease of OLD family
MELSQFEISNFRSIAQADFSPGDITVLIGKNNSGKSAIQKALLQYKRAVVDDIHLSNIHKTHVRNWDKSLNVNFTADYYLTENDSTKLYKKLVENGETPRELNYSFLHHNSFSKIRHEISISRNGLSAERLFTSFRDNSLLISEVVFREYQGQRKKQAKKIDFGKSAESEEPVFTGRWYEYDDSYTPLRHTESALFSPFNSVIEEFLSSIRFIGAIRRPEDAMQVGESHKLNQDADNLTQVLHTYSQNPPSKFRKIESTYQSIMNGVSGLTTPINGAAGTAKTTIKVHENTIKQGIPLKYISSGSKEILALLTTIVDAREDTNLLLIEEPELHLHPEAERKVFELISSVAEDGPQVFVTTHSDVFVNEAESDSIIRVARDKSTELHDLSGRSLDQELSDLGYDKSGLLQSRAVIFVEGKSDERVLRQLARKLDFDLKKHGVEIVDLDGEGNVKSDGKSLIKLLTEMDIPYRFILDSHSEDKDELLDKLLQHLNSRKGAHTTPQNFIIWPSYGIESYLVEVPKAIHSVVGGDYENIEKMIEENKDEEDKSIVLDEIFSEIIGEPYDKNHHGMLIARHVEPDEIPSDIADTVQEIKQIVHS